MNRLLDQLNNISRFSLILCGCLMSGQVFAAWGNDSPWSKKYSAQKEQAAAEEVVIDTPEVMPAAEPVMMEPEPVMSAPEPVMMEPEPVVESAVNSRRGTDIMSRSGKGYAVQVFACKTFEKMAEYQAKHGLEDLTAVKTERKGTQVVVLVSLHENRQSADAAAANLAQITGSKPWVRNLSGLQAIVVE